MRSLDIRVFLSAVIVTAAYLLSPWGGAAAMSVIVLGVFLRKDRSSLEKILRLLIISWPLYTTPIIPGLPVLASWTTALLLLFCVYVVRYRCPAGAWDYYLISAWLLASGAALLNSKGGISEAYYVLQFLIFLLPAILAFLYREPLAKQLEKDTGHRLFSALVAVLLATAVGVLLQFLALKMFGMHIGHVGYFKNRTTYDVLVPAYSALSAILAPGLAVAPVLWFKRNYMMAVVLPLVCGSAILINSSRTGLIAGLLGMAIFILYPLRGVNVGRSVLLLIPGSLFAFWIMQKMLGSSRFKGTNAFASNGRFETYQDGLNLWTQDLRFLLFGRGYAQYPTTPPHNFVLETLVCSGVIAFAVVAVWLCRFLIDMSRNEWMYPAVALLLASLLFSGFYNVKVFTILLICGVICSTEHKLQTREREQGKNDDYPACREIDTEVGRV